MLEQLSSRFEMLDYIGSGGFSRVYKVESKEDRRIYAMKILDVEDDERSNIKESKAYRELRNEVAILKRLDSPYIVKIIDEMILDDLPCILMEYVGGESLEQIINQNGVLDYRDIEKVILHISSALMICHDYQVPLNQIGLNRETKILRQNAVIHNDIHPKNIIKSGNVYKLIDFGLSFSGEQGMRSSKMKEGMEEYKAPEKLKGEEFMPSSDIYSFGVVLYKCLAGEEPFRPKDYDEHGDAFMQAVLNEDIPDIWRKRRQSDSVFSSSPDYPYWLQQLVEKCLQKNPGSRFRSGRELNNYYHDGIDGRLHNKWPEQKPDSEPALSQSPAAGPLVDKGYRKPGKREMLGIKNDADVYVGQGEAEGWLVVHDERTQGQAFDLMPGLNLVGRKYKDYQPKQKYDYYHEIVTGDKYMSKEHFLINIMGTKGSTSFVLTDPGSTNGTHIDTKHIGKSERQMRELKKGEKIHLEDDAVIMAGHTKIHFRSKESVGTKHNAEEIVYGQGFTKTVIL